MSDNTWTHVPLTQEYLHGAARLERTARGTAPHRLPAWALEQAADPQLTMTQAQPSGVRVTFRTGATAVELTGFRSRVSYSGMPPRPDGSVDLTVDRRPVAAAATYGGDTTVIDMSTGQVAVAPGESFRVVFDGLTDEEKLIELWLPHNETIELIDIRANAAVTPVHDERRRWVHHGSSISHGSNAARPTEIWPVAAARQADVDLVNLGFGGSALLDPFLARTIRDTRADLISVKIGINLVNTDLMRLRAFRAATHGFLDTVREGHPSTPLLLISPIHCRIHETTPGPGAFDLDALAQGRIGFRATGDPAEAAAGKLTLTTIRAELSRIVAERQAEDTNLHHLDGLVLYGAADEVRLPLPDGLHPDTETHRLIAGRFVDTVFADGPFAAGQVNPSRATDRDPNAR
ncbi:lipase [Nakamurella silvestris]|nr:lipase [Nakamurella silvestris]